MVPFRMSQALAGEGYTITQNHCEHLLNQFHIFDPKIRVFSTLTYNKK